MINVILCILIFFLSQMANFAVRPTLMGIKFGIVSMFAYKHFPYSEKIVTSSNSLVDKYHGKVF